MTSRKKPAVAFWATVGLVVALGVYPLSLGPAMWMERHGWLPQPILIPVLNPGGWFGKAWLVELGGSYWPLFLIVEAESVCEAIGMSSGVAGHIDFHNLQLRQQCFEFRQACICDQRVRIDERHQVFISLEFFKSLICDLGTG